MNPKQRIYQTIQGATVFRAGCITADNGDGTYSVREKGRAYVYTGVQSQMPGKFQVGDMVTLSCIGGDTQKPVIIGYGGYDCPNAAMTEVER